MGQRRLYIGFGHSIVDRPLKLLRRFEKRDMEPGETKTFTMPLAANDLVWYDPVEVQWVVDAMAYEVFIGSFSAQVIC
jgi:beta-glucosidase